MAVIKTTKKLSEEDVIIKLSRFFDHRKNIIVPRIFFLGGEMDLAIITPSMYLTEIEIKLTKKDWEDDIKKDKWKPIWKEQRDSELSQFYYAVPEKLFNNIPDFVQKETGLIKISEWGGCEIVRKPVKNKVKVSENTYKNFLYNTYCKFWILKNNMNDIRRLV